ncbi:MAG: hypothetical protein ACR2G0_06050 [Chthoniobacterales bacterium]
MNIKSYLIVTLVSSACCVSFQLTYASGWTEVPGPAVPSSYINGIAVLNDRNVWSVGRQINGSNQTLIEHWDGRSWSVVSSPNPFPSLNILNGVTALAPDNLWAVGYGAQGDAKTLVIHWDGAAWTSVPCPSMANLDNYLNAVRAVSPNDIWAVGYTDSPSGAHYFQPLAVHWDGTAWTIVPTPLSVGTQIRSVDVIAANDIWAVGSDINGQDFVNSTTFTMHWDGATWSVVPSPNGPLAYNSLAGVSGASSNDVWAVGTSGTDYLNTEALAVHWDGAAWSVVITAPLSGITGLTAVTTIAPNKAWAVGSTDGQALIERWNGHSWRVAPLPALQDPSGLGAISTGRRGSLWTAGAQETGQLFLEMTR